MIFFDTITSEIFFFKIPNTGAMCIKWRRQAKCFSWKVLNFRWNPLLCVCLCELYSVHPSSAFPPRISSTAQLTDSEQWVTLSNEWYWAKSDIEQWVALSNEWNWAMSCIEQWVTLYLSSEAPWLMTYSLPASLCQFSGHHWAYVWRWSYFGVGNRTTLVFRSIFLTSRTYMYSNNCI